jgi:hypothetical protein
MAEVQGHLAAQDVLLNRIAASIGLDPVPVIDTPSDEQARQIFLRDLAAT